MGKLQNVPKQIGFGVTDKICNVLREGGVKSKKVSLYFFDLVTRGEVGEVKNFEV